jgi:hypothetical protein
MTERPANTTGQLIRNSKGDCKISRTQGFEFISYVNRIGAARQSRWESRDNQDGNAPLPG